MNEKIPEKIEYNKFAIKIKEMHEKDQDMRQRALANNGVIETEEDNQLDIINTNKMKEIIEAMGWPTISKVGKEISNMAWLLIQHADHDGAFQKQCLELMKNQIDGDINKRNIAYLEDRVRINEGKSQIYGTQFFNEGRNYIPRPIEDPENVDQRRKELGMEPLEEYKQELIKKYNK